MNSVKVDKTNNWTIPYRLDVEHRRCIVGDEPMIFHCHHYNTFLQRSIEYAEYIDSKQFLIGAAAEVAHYQMKNLFSENNITDIDKRKSFAEDFYRWAGFGLLNLNSFDENGGKTTTRSSHYSMAWKTKYEISKKPVCHFACGWLSGTLAAIYDAPIDTFDVEETNCSALENSNECSFNVRRRDINWTTFKSVGVGKLNNHHPQPIPENHVDYEGVFQAVTSMDISGNEKGEIPIFGVYLTRMYANYYNRISFEFLRQFCDKFDLEGREIATSLLVEAGHVCAFNTFGGIMISPEWDALIKPNLKTKEDWVHGITAVVNALGWGRWQVTKVCEKEAEFVLHDDYESVGYGAMYGKSEFPVSFLAEGAVAGVMDLIYLGEIQKKPEFTQKFYNKLFKGENSYKVESLSSQAMGDKITSFKVFKP